MSCYMFPIGFISLAWLMMNIGISLAAASIASHKGRSAMGWFFLSFITGLRFPFNIVVLIILLILPNLNEENTRLAHEAGWRRRHQESFEQERTVNTRFREHVIKRLDRQDEKLGLPPLETPALNIPPPPKEIVTYPNLGDGTWYLVMSGQEYGPISEEEVLEMLKRGEISGDTFAWSEGMKDWQRARTIGNFSESC